MSSTHDVKRSAKIIADVYSQKYVYYLNKFSTSHIKHVAYDTFYNLAIHDIENHVSKGRPLEDWCNYRNLAQEADNLVLGITSKSA
jgi:hypothetical protein